MCYVIITLRSMAWCLLTLLDTVLMLAVLMSPKWLIGGPQTIGYNRLSLNTSWVRMQRYPENEYMPPMIHNRFSVKRKSISKSLSNNEYLLKVSKKDLSKLLNVMGDKPQSISYQRLDALLSNLASSGNHKEKVKRSNPLETIPSNLHVNSNKEKVFKRIKPLKREKKMRRKNKLNDEAKVSEATVFHPTLGIYTRCTKLRTLDHTSFSDDCGPFIRKFREENISFPNYWKVVLVLFSCGAVLMLLTSFTSIISCFVRSIFRKSIFILSGIVQAFAGLFFTLSLILYPMGWDTARVQRVCGPKAESYLLGDCEAGWALYAGIGGAGLCFICSLLTIQAEISTSNDKVQSEILEGNTLICLL